MADVVERLRTAAGTIGPLAAGRMRTEIMAAIPEIESLRTRLSQAGAGGGVVDERALDAARKVYNESLHGAAFGAAERIVKAYLAALAPATPVQPTASVEAAAIVSALLRITCQSLDAGGESARSLRALAVETAWHLISDNDDPRFERERRACDADPWSYVRKARIMDVASPLPAPMQGGDLTRLIETLPPDFSDDGNCCAGKLATPAPSPAGGVREASTQIEDLWFTDSTLPILAISGDDEHDSVICLHCRRPATNADRDQVIAALNAALSSPATPEPVSAPANLAALSNPAPGREVE